jgi:hypothetical protein
MACTVGDTTYSGCHNLLGCLYKLGQYDAGIRTSLVRVHLDHGAICVRLISSQTRRSGDGKDKEEETKAQRQEDEGTVCMKRILDDASNRSAAYRSRHTERQCHELLLDERPHRTNIAN